MGLSLSLPIILVCKFGSPIYGDWTAANGYCLLLPELCYIKASLKFSSELISSVVSSFIFGYVCCLLISLKGRFKLNSPSFSRTVQCCPAVALIISETKCNEIQGAHWLTNVGLGGTAPGGVQRSATYKQSRFNAFDY